MSNALAHATSPYLLQHRDNPVDWVPWGDAAFARAGAEDKPILLSIGYAACHWCHVMAHESFEDKAIARLMNENFVCVKVDREERPDLDQVYQTALATMEGQGGWPLTMFLRPDGAPFWGGTYFPPDARWGRPGFPDVLLRIAELYRTRPEQIADTAREMLAAVTAMSQPGGGPRPELSPGFLDRAAAALLPAMDPVYGGLNGAPKFPQLSVLELLWRAHLRGDAAAGDAVCLALDRMCQGGIYDHLGGGFARYAVEETWLVPHFEKMLYDNAQFIALLTQVWRKTRSALYAARVAETVAWALREMRDDGGAFVSSFDADSDGEEGRFAVWTADEIAEVLGDRAAPFSAAYGVLPHGNWEGVNILHRSRQPFGSAADETLLAADRAALLSVRDRRVPPARDDKVLADWNGLMIAALVEAATAFDNAAWLAAARQAFAAVVAGHGDGDRLAHSACAGVAGDHGFLDDHAAMARAALALFEATGDGAHLDRARAWAAELDRRFGDPQSGGYFFAADDGDARLLVRPRHAHDSAQPSGNALAAEVLARLYWLDGDVTARDRAEAVFGAFAPGAARNPVALAALLNAGDVLAGAVQIVVVGRRGEPDTDALVRAAFALPTLNRLVRVVAPGGPLPPGHPAAGKLPVDGRAAAYVCVGPVCAAPVVDAAVLAAAWEQVR